MSFSMKVFTPREQPSSFDSVRVHDNCPTSDETHKLRKLDSNGWAVSFSVNVQRLIDEQA